MIKIGDEVQLKDTARPAMFAYREEGPEKEAIQKTRVGTALDQAGVREQHLVIVFRVDFGEGNSSRILP
jgi:hypothetical protein